MWNEQLGRDEYVSRLAELNLKNYKTILALKEKFNELYLKSIHRYINHSKMVNSTGDNIDGVKIVNFVLMLQVPELKIQNTYIGSLFMQRMLMILALESGGG